MALVVFTLAQRVTARALGSVSLGISYFIIQALISNSQNGDDSMKVKLCSTHEKSRVVSTQEATKEFYLFLLLKCAKMMKMVFGTLEVCV